MERWEYWLAERYVFLLRAQHIQCDAVNSHWANGNIQNHRSVRGILMKRRHVPYQVICFCCADGRISAVKGAAHALSTDIRQQTGNRNTYHCSSECGQPMKSQKYAGIVWKRPLFATEVYANGEKNSAAIVTANLTERYQSGSSKHGIAKTVITARKGSMPGMKQIKCLHTDPLKWLDKWSSPFYKIYVRCFMHPVLRYFVGSVLVTFP